MAQAQTLTDAQLRSGAKCADTAHVTPQSSM